MRKYELACIFDAESSKANALKEDIKQIVTGSGATLDDIEDWGRRKLAYPIKNHTDGTYVFYHCTMEPSTVDKIDKELSIREDIVRYRFIRADE